MLIVIIAVTHWLVGPIQGFSTLERRTYQTTVDFSLRALMQQITQQQSQAFLDDQFFAKESWLKGYNLLQLSLGNRWVSSVIIGSNSQLYNAFLYDTAQLKNNISMIESFYEKYPSTQIMIVPASISINFNDYPLGLKPVQSSWFDHELLSGLRNHLIDVFDSSFLYRTDHHLSHHATLEFVEYLKRKQPSWVSTDHVELVACNDFFGTLAPSVINPLTKPDNLMMFDSEIKQIRLTNKIAETLHQSDSCNDIDPYAALMHGNHGFSSIITNQTNQRRLLVIKDSHAHQLIAFMTESFSQIDIVDFRLTEVSLSQLVENNDYDGILFLVGEGSLRNERWFYKLGK